MATTFKNIENEYRKLIGEKILDVDEFISIALKLYKEIKVEGISDSYTESDMLLFQYGVYDWGDENGNHFSFDITRQFIDPEEDEPYQLNFTLIFEPSAFSSVEPCNCWSDEFACVEDFSAHIKSTEGYKYAIKKTPKKVQLIFGQC